MESSLEKSIDPSGDDEINSVTSGIELALIRLEYLSADSLHVYKNKEKEVLARKIAKCYRAACHALEVSILMMEQVETQRRAAWVG
jgi:hypothetical protein